MKYLKIDNSKGFYCTNEEEYKEIDKINKEDLLVLIDKITETDFEMDTFDQEKIANKAHQIIYKSVYEKFKDLLSNKTKFKDDSEQLYKEAISEYSK